MRKRKGFTLIELVMVILILGVLSAVAIPKYFSLLSDANTAAEQGVVGGVSSGINTYFAQNKAWPATLDSAAIGAATKTNAFFGTVVAQPITKSWTKAAGAAQGDYTGPASGVYRYTAATGTFTEQ